MTGSKPCRRSAFPAREQQVRGAGILTLTPCRLSRHRGPTSDSTILAGAVIGVCLASSAKIAAVPRLMTRPAMRWLEQFPGTYLVFSLGSFPRKEEGREPPPSRKLQRLRHRNLREEKQQKIEELA